MSVKKVSENSFCFAFQASDLGKQQKSSVQIRAIIFYKIVSEMEIKSPSGKVVLQMDGQIGQIQHYATYENLHSSD